MPMDYQTIAEVIEEQFERDDLTADDILRLVLAYRLNKCSDSSLKGILGGAPEPPLNFWNRR